MATNLESTHQGIPFEGNPSPFSSWGNIGAPYMATLSIPGLTIGLPIWLFWTSVIQSTMIPEQSNEQLDDTKVTPQPSTSFVSPSPSSSSLGEASKTKNQVTEKKKKGKEKKKNEPMVRRGNHTLSRKNPHIAPSKPKSPCVISKGDHYH